MSRWGEEEKKSKGIISCAVAIFILGFVVFGFSRVYPVLEARRQLEDDIQNVSRSAHDLTPKEVQQEIMNKVRNLNMDVFIAMEDIIVTKVRDDTGSLILTVKLEYVEVMDFAFFEYDVPVQISERVPLISF